MDGPLVVKLQVLSVSVCSMNHSGDAAGGSDSSSSNTLQQAGVAQQAPAQPVHFATNAFAHNAAAATAIPPGTDNLGQIRNYSTDHLLE